MLPGPFVMPQLLQIPSNISPVLVWMLIVLAAVLLAVTFFRFLFAESSERASKFLAFFFSLVMVIAFYLALINANEIEAFFRRLIQPLMLKIR